MIGDVKVSILVKVEDGKTEVTVGNTNDEGFTDGIEITIPEDVIRGGGGGWKCDPFDNLHSTDDCYEGSNPKDFDGLRDIVVRQHDNEHEGSRLWCPEPVCRFIFGER